MMRPLFNSQIQTNGNSAPPPQHQGNSSNPRPPNNFQGNPMPNSTQIQPQMGMMNNSQIQNPFNNYNGQTSTSFFMNNPNVPFINAQFPLQNGMPGQQGQFYNGFNCPQNMSPIMMNNNCQPNPGLYAPPNSMNISPYFNQNIGFPPNGQINPMCQFFQMQMPNYNNPQAVQGMFQNHLVSQTMAPQMQMPNYNSNRIMQEQQQKQQNNNTNRLIPPNSMVNGLNNASQQQGNLGKENGVNIPNTNWKNSPNKNLGRNTNVGSSHKGLMTSQFHQKQDSNAKFKFHNERGEKAYNNRAKKSGFAPSNNQTQVEKKRSVPLNYTEEEIRQWREERKKNFPSKDNADKKLTKGEIADRDAKLRRQQLKEILTKQAELGCEVAEIPRDYLSDSDKLINGRENNKRGFNKRQQNNFNNKRGKGRFGKNNRFNVNDQIGEDSFSNKKQRVEKKENTTLLQKLLCSDVKRDKAHLLQVFRFVVMNSYLKEYNSENKQMLKFPHVVVKQVEEGCLVPKINEDKVIQEQVNVGDEETEIRVVKEKGTGRIVEEEEGEIID